MFAVTERFNIIPLFTVNIGYDLKFSLSFHKMI